MTIRSSVLREDDKRQTDVAINSNSPSISKSLDRNTIIEMWYPKRLGHLHYLIYMVGQKTGPFLKVY